MNDCGCDQLPGELLPLQEALNLLLKDVTVITEIETIPVLDSLGRILAKDIKSSVNVPPADNSAMDGYAVRCVDLARSGEQGLDISQRICAGETGTSLKPGTVARIFTGAPVPDGADAIVMQEYVQQQQGNQGYGRAVFDASLTQAEYSIGRHIRKAGEDIKSGQVILGKGKKLRPQDIGLAASVGFAECTVYRKMRVVVFSTGDELREPGEKLKPGQIYNSNRYVLTGLLRNLGCEVIDSGIVPDDYDSTRNALQKAAAAADLIISSGGVSVGEEDHIKAALESLGKLQMWQVAIKPGKPVLFGELMGNQCGTSSNTPLIGLPGNPVSAFATFYIFARPYILTMQGQQDVDSKHYLVKADFSWGPGKRQEFLRARLEHDQGVPVLRIFAHQGSGVLSSTTESDGFAVIHIDQAVNPGDLVEFMPYT